MVISVPTHLLRLALEKGDITTCWVERKSVSCNIATQVLLNSRLGLLSLLRSEVWHYWIICWLCHFSHFLLQTRDIFSFSYHMKWRCDSISMGTWFFHGNSSSPFSMVAAQDGSICCLGKRNRSTFWKEQVPSDNLRNSKHLGMKNVSTLLIIVKRF